MIRIAVIAGTPVDTQMGVDYINKKSSEPGAAECEALYLPVSDNCDDQVKFQYSSYAEKHSRMDALFDPAIAEGVRDFFIYCNSLSGAFDFDAYAEEKGVNIYTPLQVYRKLAPEYNRIGVVAANNLSAYNIEKTLMEANEDIYMIGSGNMAIVSAIEEGLPPSEIVEKCGIGHMIRYMEACGCSALLLGCTHFPYLKEEIRGICNVPIIDPADEMYNAIMVQYQA